MSHREEQDLAGTVIDSLKFAADEGRIAGRLALADLPRLADVLVDNAGWLGCELTGNRETGEPGKPGLHLRVSGRLALRCQRCLGEVGFECDIDSRLLLVPSGAGSAGGQRSGDGSGDAWPEDELEAEDYDAIPASREMSVLELVEEEVLLALPLVPRHADCLPPAGLAADAAAVEEKSSGPSPFQVLGAVRGLKKH